MITELPDGPGVVDPDGPGGPDHPMRKVTREVAFEQGWSPGRATKVAELFDSLADEWARRDADPARQAPIVDALDRGQVDAQGQWVELGSGTGSGTRHLAERVDRLVTIDLSAQMLARAPALAPKVRADASSLPLPDGSVDAVLAVNMLLFPDEIDRILAPDGALVWVNTVGDQTPIHLSTTEVVQALPGRWQALTARAGSGLWATVRRLS